jgi:SAM-dependent methyltransferase
MKSRSDNPSRRGRKDTIRSHYEPRISPHREHHEILDWASSASQRARFTALADHVDLRGKSLLDVGCGLGDLLGYLEQRGVAVDYTGVDILEAMVEAARQRHPNGRFICADVFVHSPFGREFDVVFCSGIFNLNLGNNLEFLPQALERLLELSRRLVVINLLHTRDKSTDDRYFHYDPAHVLDVVQKLGCEAKLVDDYLPNDFTIVCRRV